MKGVIAFVVLGVLVLSGCEGKPTETASSPPANPNGSPNGPSAQGGGDGIAPMTPDVGGVTPVTGSDSVAGAGGGGVQSAAKDAAKRAAAKASSPNPSNTEDGSGQ